MSFYVLILQDGWNLFYKQISYVHHVFSPAFLFSEETPYDAWSQQASTTEWRPGCRAAICVIDAATSAATHCEMETLWPPPTGPHLGRGELHRHGPHAILPCWESGFPCYTSQGRTLIRDVESNTSPSNSYLIRLQQSRARLPNNWTYGAAVMWGYS